MSDVQIEQCDVDCAQDIIAVEFENNHAAYADSIAALIARHRQAAEKAQQERGFNVNESIWVKLTDEGRAYHRRWYSERYPMLPYRTPDESNGGWSKWQLWSLMQEFGDDIYLGCRMPFETTIRLTDPTTAIRSQGHE